MFFAEKLKNVNPKFQRGDIGFTVKDKEKILVLKCIGFQDDRNDDLGPSYLVRGDKNYTFCLYEFEIQTIDEAVS